MKLNIIYSDFLFFQRNSSDLLIKIGLFSVCNSRKDEKNYPEIKFCSFCTHTAMILILRCSVGLDVMYLLVQALSSGRIEDVRRVKWKKMEIYHRRIIDFHSQKN